VKATILKSNSLLCHAKRGDKIRISKYNENFENINFLLSLGVLPGDELEVLSIAPFHGPIALKHGESNFFALRAEEAKFIEISYE
jgi:Fe2+ transport system protein FeoA